MKKEAYWRMRKEGRCVVCGDVLKEGEKTRCAYCTKKMKISMQNRYQQLRNEGTCVICRKAPARPDRCTCVECGKLISDNNKRYRERMRAERRAHSES